MTSMRLAFLSFAVIQTLSLLVPALGTAGYFFTRRGFEAQRRAVFAILASEVA